MTLQRLVYVLHIFPKLSETFVAGELAELRRRGVELRILSLLPPRAELQHEIIRRMGLAELTTYDVARFTTVIREFQPQLLHAHFATEATATARELSATCGVPFTFTAHGYDIHRKPPADFRARALAARAVVTVSAANADYIANTFNVPAEDVRVIPCGVDTEQFCPRNEHGKTAVEPPWIVCVARHVKVKNLGLLLDACAALRRRGLEFRCAMVGEGPLHGELKARRAALGLEGLVEMPGAAEQSDVLKWWQRAAVGVLSSENEGMPVSLMEAAACGVPVVAPAVGGIPELVRDGETGLLAKVNDLESLVAALERLLRDAELRAQFGAAARQRAVEKFSVRRQVDQLLEVWSSALEVSGNTRPHPSPLPQERAKPGAATGVSNITLHSSRIIPVTDPFNAAADAALPMLGAALDPAHAASEFKRRLPSLSGEGRLKLKAIRVVRHKPGKRCVMEYDVEVRRPGEVDHAVTLIGKVRARRSGNEGFRQLEAIWNAGFDAQSADGISVPEPVGVISEFKMWCQRKVPGETATMVLRRPEGAALARRIAEAMHKLHRANLPTERAHTMGDELRILRECFAKLTVQKPGWTARLARLLVACEQLGAGVPPPNACGIHRDFYSSQVIVDGARLWLIDFDCFCLGDPGLDVGNFLGHVIEQALRERGDGAAFGAVEYALEERFVQLSGERVRAAVRAYTTLTLARHIYLSTQFPERAHTTERLLELCERRVDLRQ